MLSENQKTCIKEIVKTNEETHGVFVVKALKDFTCGTCGNEVKKVFSDPELGIDLCPGCAVKLRIQRRDAEKVECELCHRKYDIEKVSRMERFGKMVCEKCRKAILQLGL